VQWKRQSGSLLVSSFTLFHPKRGGKEPTTTRATRHAEYTGPAAPCLYLAFELGSTEWKLGFTTAPGAKPRVRTMPARDLARLTREIADETGEWEIIARPYTTNAGKDVHVLVKRVDNADVTMIRTWAAQERIAVKRQDA
jgi:hypothetical protein